MAQNDTREIQFLLIYSYLQNTAGGVTAAWCAQRGRCIPERLLWENYLYLYGNKSDCYNHTKCKTIHLQKDNIH